MNGHGCAPIKPYMWTLKTEFHIIFLCHKILCFFWFFSQPLENVETIHGLPATQTHWAAGQMDLHRQHHGDAPCLSYLIGTKGMLMAPIARHWNRAWHTVRAGEKPHSGVSLRIRIAKWKQWEPRSNQANRNAQSQHERRQQGESNYFNPRSELGKSEEPYCSLLSEPPTQGLDFWQTSPKVLGRLLQPPRGSPTPCLEAGENEDGPGTCLIARKQACALWNFAEGRRERGNLKALLLVKLTIWPSERKYRK